MKVLFLLLRPATQASSRVRGFWVIEELIRLEVRCKVLVGRDNYTLFKTLLQLPWCDVLFLQKGYTRWHFYLAVIAKIMGKKVVLDFDDKYSTIDSRKTLKYIIAVLKRVDLTIVGSKNLLVFANRYQQNSILVPSSIRLKAYTPSEPKTSDAVCVLGWLGNGKHYCNDLVQILKDPVTVLAGNTSVKLKIVGACGQQNIYDAFEDIPNLETEFIDTLDWSDQKVVNRAISDFDVGLYPLLGNDYNTHKCGFKALEYMAMALPVVASPVGANSSIVTEGVDGYLPESPESWINRLSLLVNNIELRQKMGRAGRLQVNSKYNVEIAAARINEQLEKLVRKQGQ